MTATPHAPSPQKGRSVAAWCAALLQPVAAVSSVLVLPDPSLTQTLLTAVTMALLAPLMRRNPLAALVLGLLSLAATATQEVPSWTLAVLLVGCDMMIVYIGAVRRRRFALGAGTLAFAAQLACSFSLMTDLIPWGNVLLPYFMSQITGLLLGQMIRERRAHEEAIRQQAAAQAVTAERLSIARELHDVIAHSVGVIAIQAGMGRRVIDTQPEQARNALAAIEASSRETLFGLRRTLVALRRSDADAADAAAALSPLGPAPGLAEIDKLLASAGDAGVAAELRWHGERGPLPPEVDLAAFRIVQEALTNVVRHAGVERCLVTIDRSSDDEVVVTVADPGRGGVVSGTGFGILGMEERVGLLGGRFRAGPGRDGGFQVEARLPVPGAVVAP
ncbi:sensor histidine kinase [Streptomyces sp. 3MP-14]|uniref:histidine kinase n=1 Tax=Streptomyces mimosae TaxID=2586635 RepID=A0A5N6A2C2_9ACTN|nr:MULTISPECIES: histidine kinase [Streptomyces]KAB8162253.1 sensor histidine kinase [Streptomyces mimosae]KAB8173848.1 sensor histidine kinase [Streptomyces sp. 3MP-14]